MTDLSANTAALNRLAAAMEEANRIAEGRPEQPVICPDEARICKIATIQKIVAGHFGIEPHRLSNQQRDKDLVLARHIAMALAYELTDASQPMVARAFKKKCHSSVTHATTRMEILRHRKDPSVSSYAMLAQRVRETLEAHVDHNDRIE